VKCTLALADLLARQRGRRKGEIRKAKVGNRGKKELAAGRERNECEEWGKVNIELEGGRGMGWRLESFKEGVSPSLSQIKALKAEHHLST